MVQFNLQFRKIVDDFLQKIEFGAVQKDVSLVDLEKCCKMSIYYLFAKFGFDTAENEPLKVCQQLAKR